MMYVALEESLCLPPPLASITQSTSNKRSTPDTEPDITIPKKSGRKRK